MLLLFVLLFSFNHAFAGEVEDLIKKMQARFSQAKTLEYTCAYELFRGHKGTEIHSAYDGYVCRNDKQVYQKIKNTEFVYGTDFFLKISHEEKALSLDLAQTNIVREVDMSTIFEYCEEKNVDAQDTYYTVTLKYKYASPSPFRVVKMRIDKKTFQLTQLDLYYTNSQNFSTIPGRSDMAQPHLRIRFSTMKTELEVKKELFEFSKYIETKNQMLIPAGNCKGYELIDNRI